MFDSLPVDRCVILQHGSTHAAWAASQHTHIYHAIKDKNQLKNCRCMSQELTRWMPSCIVAVGCCCFFKRPAGQLACAVVYPTFERTGLLVGCVNRACLGGNCFRLLQAVVWRQTSAWRFWIYIFRQLSAPIVTVSASSHADWIRQQCNSSYRKVQSESSDAACPQACGHA